jgi:hypothetical protein
MLAAQPRTAQPRKAGSVPYGAEVLADGLGHRVVQAQVLLAVGQGPLQHRDHVGEPAGRVVRVYGLNRTFARVAMTEAPLPPASPSREVHLRPRQERSAPGSAG